VVHPGLESIGEPGLYRGIELSPDGKHLAVHRHKAPGGNLAIQLERGTFSRLTFERGHDVSPVWSVDTFACLWRIWREKRDSNSKEASARSVIY
jgi:hypothetical protein